MAIPTPVAGEFRFSELNISARYVADVGLSVVYEPASEEPIVE
jgi:hypothetical protein